MRQFAHATLLAVPALALACSGESDCTQSATCPSPEGADAGLHESEPSAHPTSTAKVDPTEPPEPDERDAGTAPSGNDATEALDAGGADAGGMPPLATLDAAVEVPVGENDAGTEDAGMQNADPEPPVVVIVVADRDAGPAEDEDAGRELGCELGETRPCQDALGACAEGVETCDQNGEFGACSVQPSLVDSCVESGDDSNCDGVANDGCECTTGQERACGPELEQGICRQGISTCDAGTWGPCQGAVHPAPRQCGSPEDNDCDGIPDDALDGVCQCAAGSARPCDEHPGLDGVGRCTAGTAECVVSDDLTRAEWSDCVGAVGPLGGDLCSVPGDDSNCNGIPNQGCDFTPPVVASSLPEDGATGVRADSTVVVAFNEPMDRANTEAAITLSSGTAWYAWNATSTVLTITPFAPFAYAEGSFDSLASLRAFEYSLTIGASATDVAGNALLVPVEVEFATLRRVTQTLALSGPDGAYIITRFSEGSASPWPCQEDITWVGHQPFYSVTIATFDLRPLPSEIAQFEVVRLVAEQAGIHGDPFAFSGPVDVEHIFVTSDIGTVNAIATLEAESLRELGTLSAAPAAGVRVLEVVPALEEDYERRIQRDNQSGFRILTHLVEPGPSSPQYVDFVCSRFALETTYLIP